MSNVKKWVLRNVIWIILLILLIIGINFIEDTYIDELVRIDNMVYEFVVNNLRSDWITPTINFITDLGSPIAFIGVCIIILLISRDKKSGWMITANLFGISILNILLKNIFQRARPTGYELVEQGGYSFPSGHSMVSTAFYGLIIYFVYTKFENKKIRNLICVILSIGIILIGLSRIYLGVHYLSDIVAGFLISIIYLILVINTISKLTKKEIRRIKVTKKVANSFKYAFSGIRLALKEERNMKIHFVMIVIVIMAGVILNISTIEIMIISIVIAVVIAAELFNTAIEVLTDVIMPERNPKAKIVKDISAGAVLMVSIAAFIVGMIIFVPKIFI